jgi:hypothetical protein
MGPLPFVSYKEKSGTHGTLSDVPWSKQKHPRKQSLRDLQFTFSSRHTSPLVFANLNLAPIYSVKGTTLRSLLDAIAAAVNKRMDALGEAP